MTARLPRTMAIALPLTMAGLALPFLRSSAPTSAPRPAEDRYIGAAKCKACHQSEESGDPYGIWSEAPHAHAFHVLASDESKQLAAELGLGDPAKADACLECHVTGHGEPEDAFARGFKQELGVQCETCHGRSEAHMKARFKAAAGGEKLEGYAGVAVDEVVVSPGVDVCVECHNPKSPSYKPFCYYEKRAEIAHLDPRKPRSEEELAAYGTCPSGSPCAHAEGCPDGKCNLTPEALAALRE